MSLFVFVLMPFKKSLNERYEKIIKPVVRDAGMRPERVDKQSFHRHGITEKIVQQIEDADILIADMSFNNPNVLYEVGIAHAKDKLCILLTDKPKAIPFDLKNKRHIVFCGAKNLKKKLRKDLKALQIEAELSFDRNDTECLTDNVRVQVTKTSVVGQSIATSIRAKVRTGSELHQENVPAHMTKIERRAGSSSWKSFKLRQHIALKWANNDSFFFDFRGPTEAHINIFHIDHGDNKLTIWGASLPQALQKFLDAKARYRVTFAVLGRQLRLEVDWRAKRWDKVEVHSR
jgi:nucleoside 2-deoxyribosyltransferase